MKRIIALLALCLSLGIAIQSNSKSIDQTFKKIEATKTIETYTGEAYSLGDCESKDIYESADESVVNACNDLEGV